MYDNRLLIERRRMYIASLLKAISYPIWDTTYGWETLEGILIPEDIRLMIQITLSTGNSGNFNIER